MNIDSFSSSQEFFLHFGIWKSHSKATHFSLILRTKNLAKFGTQQVAGWLENLILMKTHSSVWTWTWTLDFDLGFVKNISWARLSLVELSCSGNKLRQGRATYWTYVPTDTTEGKGRLVGNREYILFPNIKPIWRPKFNMTSWKKDLWSK